MPNITLGKGEKLTVNVGGMELQVVESETQVAIWLRRMEDGSYLICQSWTKTRP